MNVGKDHAMGMRPSSVREEKKVRLVIADVDGTLGTQEKVLKERNSEAYFYDLLG